MSSITIAGIGPGALQLVTPQAMEAIKACDILIAGKRNLRTFEHLKKETMAYSSINNLLDQVEKMDETKNICVAVSGDPGFYSLLDQFILRFGRDNLRVIPGISSLQYLFSQCVKPWKEYEWVSLHGRKENLKKYLNKKGVFILTDKVNTPAQIAKQFLEGKDNWTMIVGENLSYPNEKIIQGKPDEIVKMEFSTLCVVVVEKDGMEL